MSTRACPAMLVGAPASGQGKTCVTAAIARFHALRGRRVQVFKTGPDFIDPSFLARAAGRPAYQLDLWMGGETHCRSLLSVAAAEADLILVEGAMGLFDGAPSSADLALAFALPVLAVIDAGAMAQTFGAVAHGLALYRDGIRLTGVVGNRVGGAAHARMLETSLPPGIKMKAALPYDARLLLPERHLGLVQARELDDLDLRLDRWADAWAEHGTPDLPPEVAFPLSSAPLFDASAGASLRGLRIAIARDAAFSFIYPANLDVLHALGAETVVFSPIADATMPPADALWLPGGYPELHLDALAHNQSMIASIRTHHAAGKAIVAECGGMLYLLDSLADVRGRRAALVGLLPGSAAMQPRLAALGLQAVNLPEGSLRGHSFHFSRSKIRLEPLAAGRCPNGGATAEAVYRKGSLTASYMHFYFPSNPLAVARLFSQ